MKDWDKFNKSDKVMLKQEITLFRNGIDKFKAQEKINKFKTGN